MVLLALHATYAFSVGFDHNISDRMGFRQTQTALASRTLLEGSPWFAYELPVFGPPYGLPLEFPLYQGVTALLVAIGGMPLIAAGRIVSIVPQYPGHPFNGYSTSVDITRLKRGLHTVSASAVLEDETTHPVGKRTFLIP